MRDKVLIFGGTTEGRELAAALSAAGVAHLVSVATDYGREIEDSFGEKNVIVGRKNSDEMAELMVSGGFSACVDATHPFATLVSAEIKKACEKTGVEYIRLLRDTGAKVDLEIASSECGADKSFDEKVVCASCDSVVSAAKELEKIQGNILLLTGSKDLKAIMTEISEKSRVYARVLPNIESITKCEEAGLRGKQIIAMQGPFSKDMNVALIKEIGASVILTKESGATGGLDEKLIAARECGIKVIMIKSPESRAGGPGSNAGAFAKGYSLVKVLEKLGVDDKGLGSIKAENDEINSIGVIESGENEKKCRVSNDAKTNIGKRIILAGIGPGDARYYTRELEDALESADVIFGAKSILERVDKSGIKAEFVPLYMGKDILEYLESDVLDKSDDMHEVSDKSVGGNKGMSFYNSCLKYKNPLALFSGDISLCSGAKNAAKVFESAGYVVKKISGISSIALFANRLGLGLEDCSIVSAHGRECNVAGYIAETKRLIILPSSCAHAGEIARVAFDVADSICVWECENETAEQIGLKYASEVNAEGLNDDANNEAAAGCGSFKVVIGYELGTDSEKILEITREDLGASEEILEDSTSGKKVCEYGRVSCGNSIFSSDEKGKCLLYIENKRAGETPVIRGISDDEFIRGKTPMTKEEIRAISIRKLGLSADSVLYDIGAGTGSVSVEAALLHPNIKVCAIERNDEAVELIKKNKEKFCADNITVIKGEASEVLGKMAVSEMAASEMGASEIAAPEKTEKSGIPASVSEHSEIDVKGKLLVPTHAFIGGSGGNMRTIIELLMKKNPNVRIVINCVTLETLTEVLAVIKEGEFAEPDIVQVSASRYRKVGEYHMADAINPVYIVTVSGV